MAGVFYISGLNGFRWTLETFTPDRNLNSLPADYDIDPQSYAAPIQQTDTEFPALILLSDFPSMTLEFRKCTGELISNPALGATSSSLIGQSFLQYLAIVDFSAFPIGRCYGRVYYDANLPANINSQLTELLSPFVDGNLQTKINDIDVSDLDSAGSFAGKANAGLSYSFEAYATETSAAMNPRIRLTVTKTVNNVATIIFDQSAVQTDIVSITKAGTVQPGATYSAVVVTEDTAVVVAPIDIADDEPVTPDMQNWISCPIDVQANHPCTQLLKYQSSKNTESVLFNPGNIILQMRVAGNMIGGYLPKSANQTTEDQPYNPLLLNGYDYDYYTWCFGDIQCPDWLIKKINLIFAKCDQTQIDYDFYVKVGDIKFDRPEGTKNRNALNPNVDLQIVKGFDFGQLTAGTTPTGDLIVVRKTWPAQPPFPNFTSSFVINGVFTQYSTIDYFETVNPDLATFILKIGTTLGGNDIYEGEIGTPNADATIELIETHRPLTGFNVPVSIYVTLPDGVNIKLIVVYDQLDSPAISGTPGPGSGIPQGMVGGYKELVAGYFDRDWDGATGLGQVGSEWEGFKIYDESAGKVIVGWDRNTIDPSLGRGTPGITGANQVGAAYTPVVVSANANIGAVALTIDALTVAIPANTKMIINTGAGQALVMTTALANIGAVLLAVVALTNTITAGANYRAIGLAGGNEVVIARENLPNEGLSMFTSDVNNTNGDTPGPADEVARAASDGRPLSYEMRRGPSGNANVGVTAPMGAGTAISIANDGLILLRWIKL